MKAKNGFGRLGIRRGFSLVGCVAALVALSVMMASPSIAGAKRSRAKPITRTYLALGDSLAFGYSQQLFNENEKLGVPPTAFEHGYTNDYFNEINASGRLQLVNNGCPGETSESLIGSNALLSELNEKLARNIAIPVTGEAVCAYHTVNGLALHHEYGGSKSQLESAIETIAQEKAAGKPVRIISLNIGANDELHVLKGVEKEATAQIEAKVAGVAKAQVFAKVFKIAEEEVKAFVVEQVTPQASTETGGKEPQFAERIAVLAGEYSASHAAQLKELTISDATAYGAAHGKELEKLGHEIAIEYATTHAAELKAEGETIAVELFKKDAPALFEQIVTNVTAIVVGLRDGASFGGVNYHGPIVFQGGYDPFGNVYGTGEITKGSNALAEQLNLAVQATVTKPIRINGKYVKPLCFVNPHPNWNPGGAEEPLRLSKWTNMANFTEFAGKKNGPDIHPTPEGYAQLAKEMSAACPA